MNPLAKLIGKLRVLHPEFTVSGLKYDTVKSMESFEQLMAALQRNRYAGGIIPSRFDVMEPVDVQPFLESVGHGDFHQRFQNSYHAERIWMGCLAMLVVLQNRR
jgi:hypothetical protein